MTAPPRSPRSPVADTRLTALLDAAVDGIILIDTKGQITRFNLAAERMFGYAQAEVLGRNVSILMPEPYRSEHDGYMSRYAQTREPRIIGIGREVIGRRKDGTTFPLDLAVGEFQATGEYLQTGQHGYVGILRDISGRKAQEAQLRAASARLSGIIESAMDAVISIGADQRVALFNAAAEKMFGCTAADAIGRPIDDFIPERFRSTHAAHIRRFGETGITTRAMGREQPIWGLRADGTEFPIDASISQADTPEGKFYTVILRDITQRKEQEEKLRRNEENLRLIFEHAPTAILITGPRGRIAAANPAACALLGYAAGELVELRQSDLFAQNGRDRAVEQLRKMAESGGQVGFECEYQRRDGSVFQALTHSSVARDAKGEPLMVVSEIVDRSALLEATREAEDLRNRLTHVGRIGILGEMVSGIAHEVNQPLTAISSYASACRRMLESGQAQPRDLAETLEKISRQAERAGDVIRGLRNLLRKRDQVRQSLDCNQLVREVIGITGFQLRQSGFRLVENLSPELPKVVGDGVQLQQVVLNLIRNAQDAMGQQARGDAVEISTLSDGDHVEIQVADSGPGIPEAVAERLFEPFFTTKPQGIGLGLSICKSIMAAHNGALLFSSNAWGGTTFRVRLPAAEADSAG